MVGFLIGRILRVVPTVLGITLVTFTLVRLIPGDPVVAMMGETGLNAVGRERALAMLGLDRPLHEQYLIYLGNILRGDFSRSIGTSESVLKEFLALLPATLELGTAALLLALLVGIPAGVIAAVKRGSLVDHATIVAALSGYSMPVFWWGLLLILLFSGTLGWTPVSGRLGVQFYFEPITGFHLIDSLLVDEPGALTSAVRHVILPAIVLATFPLAVIARMTRSSMLEVLNDDYVRTARAKGLPGWRVVNVHALRNALIPVITVIGLQISVLVTGAVMTETIFSWPGVGKWLLEGVYRRDYPVVQGGVLLLALMVVAVNLLVDLLYGVVNPRIRHAR
ncbi:MAG: ABC transporter permease subunit [Alphaproteobacteria bacterium]|nr:ABC transporter permease subunit [Alphaproteobacteria bacterium]